MVPSGRKLMLMSINEAGSAASSWATFPKGRLTPYRAAYDAADAEVASRRGFVASRCVHVGCRVRDHDDDPIDYHHDYARPDGHDCTTRYRSTPRGPRREPLP